MARLSRDKRTRAAVLIATIAVVVIASTVGPGLLRGTDEGPPPAYVPEEQLPEPAPAEGAIAVEAREDTGVVLIDMAHQNGLSQAEMDPLLTGITSAGYEIDLLEREDDLDRSLTRADAFVVIDPRTGYSDAEVDRVQRFVDRGGRLLLVGEPTTLEAVGRTLIERSNRLTQLSSRFGFEFGEAHLFNMERNDGNHQNVFAEPVGDRELTEGVSRTAFYAATHITVREGRAVLVAGPGTRSSRTDAAGTYPVAAVNGNVLAIADGTFLRRGNFNVVDNERLVGNVVRFLVSGEKREGLARYPTIVSTEPTVHYTRAALVDAAQRLGTDLRERGRQPTLAISRGPVSPSRTDVLVTTFDYLGRYGSLETGVRVSGGFVSVTGYNSATAGVAVVSAPAAGYDLVIAAETPALAELAVEMLADGSLREHLLDQRTAVVRTDEADSAGE